MGKKRTVLVGSEEKKAEKVHIAGLKGGQRVKLVEAEPVVVEKETKRVEAKKVVSKKGAKVRGQRYKAARAKVEKGKEYPVEEAIELAKSINISKFVGKIGAHLILSDNFNTQIELPHSTGETKRIEIANEATLAKLEKGVIDFDVLLATPAMMPKLAKYAKLLGPKGLFPNPKNGTVVDDPEKSKDKFGGNNVKIATEKGGKVVHIVIGKSDQKSDELIANLKAVLAAIPGRMGLKKVVVAATMGPGVRVQV